MVRCFLTNSKHPLVAPLHSLTSHLLAEYIPDNSADTEPDFQYTPDTYGVTSPLPPGGDPLSGSLSLLQEGLDNTTALTQFEVSHQKGKFVTSVYSTLSPFSNCTGRSQV